MAWGGKSDGRNGHSGFSGHLPIPPLEDNVPGDSLHERRGMIGTGVEEAGKFLKLLALDSVWIWMSWNDEVVRWNPRKVEIHTLRQDAQSHTVDTENKSEKVSARNYRHLYKYVLVSAGQKILEGLIWMSLKLWTVWSDFEKTTFFRWRSRFRIVTCTNAFKPLKRSRVQVTSLLDFSQTFFTKYLENLSVIFYTIYIFL